MLRAVVCGKKKTYLFYFQKKNDLKCLLQMHYDNTPIQYTGDLNGGKNDKF